eukprot:Gregarina_sp_Poly_1__3438@NODE_199_length_11565_cov_209_900244_g178_i0_p8_GENE_NODE_199_length_11565_cov_209_900244_g178_i0NODE_199_length_11565_cov_209_900244_g178_i0_p8_ORF_typecomplete_len161_score18_31Ribosomal_L21e/PF01157_18/1_5e37Ribosomal_L21e/PF01157_18/7_3e03Complex1_LYR/PF05347_15/0_63_NODE_199_length_11565_cov_209_900244_g178_i01101411496
MTHAYGLRHGTRYKFAKGFRQHGMPNLSKYLTVYKRGDYVTVKTDGAIQKGMPHMFYHGRTGVVYDVTPRAVGVMIPKRVGNREILKKFHIRIEHVFKSRCREEFHKRRAENDRLHREAAKTGKKVAQSLKRVPAGPAGDCKVVPKEIKELSPIKFEEIF